jgi:hypothetical protein
VNALDDTSLALRIAALRETFEKCGVLQQGDEARWRYLQNLRYENS